MTMHAIRLHAFGPAENLRYERVPAPRPGPGQVRIAVAAAGVHLLDTSIRAGVRGGPFPLPQLPMIPGREVAGRVDEVGEGVDPGWVGRRAVAHLGQASGGYAEFAVCNAASLHATPEGLGDEAAAAMIGTGRTAMLILDAAAVGPGDVVLITAAAGGLGNLLVQAGRNAGATVVGVAGGAAKVERVKGLGAAAAVDYTDPGWPDAVRGALAGREVTVALDGVGGKPGRDALDLLGVGGRLVLFGWSSGEPTPFGARDLYARSLTATVAVGPKVFKGGPAALRALEGRSLAAAATGELVPLVHPAFSLERAADAHRAIESRATSGKVVLKVA